MEQQPDNHGGHGHCTEEHSHHHHHHSQETGGIHISRHEEAVIGSLRGSLPVSDFQEARQMVSAQMREIGRRVSEQGGIIGHIKFILGSPEKCCQISLTDTSENVRYFDSDSCRIEGVAIVFLISEEELGRILRETLGGITEGDGRL